MIFRLPCSVEIGGENYSVRTETWEIFDIIGALNDPEIDEWERVYSAVSTFYLDFGSIPAELYQEAVKKCFWFIDGGADRTAAQRQARLVDFEQDFPMIVAAINSKSPQDIRTLEHYHWWTFIADYSEKIGDSTFAYAVRIRDKQNRGKAIDKQEKEFLSRNREIVELKRKYTAEDEDIFDRFG